MQVVLILFGLAGLVWFMAAQRHLSVLVGSLLVLLTGATFGHPFFNFNVGPIPVTIDRVLLGWLVLASLVLWKMGRSDPKSFSRTDVVVVVLMTLLMVSTFLHDWSYKEKLPLTRLLFFNLIPVSFYFVAKHCRATAKDIRVFYSVLVIYGFYLGFTTICEQRGLSGFVFPRYILDPIHWEFLGRGRGPFLNPVSCGIFLSACLAASVLMWNHSRPIGRVFLGIVIVLCLVASLLTLTRSVWVGCALTFGIVTWLPARPQVRGALMVTGTLVLVVLAALFADKLDGFQRDKEVTAAEMAQSAKLRPMLAFVAYKMTVDKPVFGHGFGQYTKAKKPYHYADTNGMQLAKILPYMQHNVFLSYITETGLVGLSLLCILLATVFLKSWQLWSARQLSLEQRQFGLLGIVVITVYCCNGMFHDVSIIPNVNAILFLTLGITENLTASNAKASSGLSESRPTKVATARKRRRRVPATN